MGKWIIRQNHAAGNGALDARIVVVCPCSRALNGRGCMRRPRSRARRRRKTRRIGRARDPDGPPRRPLTPLQLRAPARRRGVIAHVRTYEESG